MFIQDSSRRKMKMWKNKWSFSIDIIKHPTMQQSGCHV